MKMNNFQFIHLCKDAGFAEPEGRLHREALDVIFFRAAQTGQRQISFKVGRLSVCVIVCEKAVPGRPLDRAASDQLHDCSCVCCENHCALYLVHDDKEQRQASFKAWRPVV